MSRTRSVIVYGLISFLGVVAFLYPFWLPEASLSEQAHSGDAPLMAAAVALLVVVALTLEVRRHTMSGMSIAFLGVLSAIGGLLRLLDLPGGGNGIFFLIVLAGAVFGARFGLLLGLCSMATSAIVSGGVGPWLPFQMLALGWMGGGAGWLGSAVQRRGETTQLVALALYAWVWGFLYGAIMNLWFWPFTVSDGDLSWRPGLSLLTTLDHYRGFYTATSFGWDAAGAIVNAVLVLLTGRTILASFRRFADRLDPIVTFEQDNDVETDLSLSARD